jgi:hypothetical protein
MTIRLVTIVVLLFLIPACSGETYVAGPAQWASDTLQPGMVMSFPQGFAGDGYRCGIDACYFSKYSLDNTISFNFPVSGMTGHTPAQFTELPAQYLYPHRELIETRSGLSSALYFVLEDEHGSPQSSGAFLIEERDGSGFREVVWVSFDSQQQSLVREILRSIDYE